MKDQTEHETGRTVKREHPAQPIDPAELRQQLLIAIGKKLMVARLASGEPLDDPARKLKLRRKHLEALENGNWAILPEGVYAMGFLRQYSHYLGLDLSVEIEQLKSSTYALTRPLTFPDPPVAPSQRWAWLSAAGFIVLMVAFNMVYQGLSSSDSSHVDVTRHDTPAVDQDQHPEVAVDQGEPATTTVTSDDSSITGDTVAAANDTAAPDEPDHAAIAPAAAIQPVTVETQIDTAAATTVAPVTADTAAATLHTYRFEAVDSAVWMQISLPDTLNRGKGKLLKEVLLHKGGEVRITEAVDSLWLTCGNAPSLRISVDGKVLAEAGSFGAGKKVLRDQRIGITN